MRVADTYGLPSVDPEIDTSLVWKRIRAIQQELAGTDDDPERFEAMGVEIVAGEARIAGPNTVRAGRGQDRDARDPVHPALHRQPAGRPRRSRGWRRPASSPARALFETRAGAGEHGDDRRRPHRHRDGPGLHPARASAPPCCRRARGILPRDEPDLVDILTAKLRDEGVDLRLNVETERVAVVRGRARSSTAAENGEPARWEGEELLVAVGRRPNVEGLGLEEVGVKVGRRGIEVDERMRTSVPSIYAAGDVAGRFLFTHSAGYEAVRAVRDAFYPGKGKVTDFVPWCTFTDPELAHAGLTVAEAEKKHGDDVEV